MRAVRDHHVDRPGVEAQQCVKLTGTNRSTGLIQGMPRHPQHVSNLSRSNDRKTKASTCTAMTWWSWRRVNTRSHPELGRENLQRRWYSVSRRGRVGRRQVFPVQQCKLHPNNNAHQLAASARWSSPRRRRPTIKNNRALDPIDRITRDGAAR